MRNARLDEAQAGIKIARRNINNLRWWYHPYGRKQRGTKEPLDKGVWWVEKAGLKPSIQKARIMASSSITSWKVDGEAMETVT